MSSVKLCFSFFDVRLHACTATILRRLIKQASVRSSLLIEPSSRRTSKLRQLWKRKAAIRIKSVDFHDVGKQLSREGQAIRSAKGLRTGLRLKFAFSQHDELRSRQYFFPWAFSNVVRT